jgi:hypothetical protein
MLFGGRAWLLEGCLLALSFCVEQRVGLLMSSLLLWGLNSLRFRVGACQPRFRQYLHSGDYRVTCMTDCVCVVHPLSRLQLSHDLSHLSYDATRSLLAQTLDLRFLWENTVCFRPDRLLFLADTPTLPTLRSECVGSAPNLAAGVCKGTRRYVAAVVRC